MNNNRNNRRRGRGSRNQGGGNSGNRIDSRARGNAPQLLDKYKKLAQDAQHNGDRVQAEYYLQFADHYFRVIADNKARQDEARGSNRRDDRDQDDDEDEDFDDNRRSARKPRSRRDDRQNDRQQDQSSDDEQQDEVRVKPRQKPRRAPREGRERDEGENYEAGDNPFSPDRQNERPNKAEAEEAPKKRAVRRRKTADDAAPAESGPAGIDAAALPPSFSDEDGAEAKPKAKRTVRSRKPDAGSKLSAVS
ncbi:DUF4167 domain-containing protein [Qipengyuania spongiae]|uniref:DUF4167 domain-containing protein n=1 Tax=Qipengyuania spongiae TaxID=2909673 RepID=A0ABY5T302_9SPHN|nr:DUF4167 domain-containing protein [Qipengyuania spongiae]UVI39736.1 DUF4167 domain-containing protein [Qipengyuania spongiae]